MYDTQNPLPRTEGKQPQKHRTAAFKNIGVGLGGLGVGYAGIKIGKAADALKQWQKMMKLCSQVREIRFAKPGEMSHKYLTHSQWQTDPQARALFEGATAIGSTEKGVSTYGGHTSAPSRSKRLSTIPPENRISKKASVRQHLPPGQSLGRRLSPQREAMMKAEIAADIHGEHKPYHEKRAKIVEAHKYELEHTYKGHPEDIVKKVKAAHRDQLNALDESYHSELRARPAYGMHLDALRKGIRKSAASEFKEYRSVLQGMRQHISGSLPSPLLESELNKSGTGRIQREGRNINQGFKTGRYKGKVFTGIAGHHGKNAPFKIAGIEKPNLPEAIHEGVGKLRAAAGFEHVRLNLRSERIKDALEKRAMVGIQKSHTSVGYAPYTQARLQGLSKRAVHSAIISPIPVEEGPDKILHAQWLGLKHPNQLDVIRKRYQKLHSPDYAGDQAVRSRLLKEGDIFKEVPKVQKYTRLKGLGKAGAVAGGILGGAYLLKKAFGRRKQTAMSSNMKLIRFQQDEPDKFKRDVAVGGLEGGLGFLTTDKLIERLSPKMNKWGKFGLAAGVGGLATGTVGYGVNRLLRNAVQKHRQQKQLEMSSRLREIKLWTPPSTEGASSPYNPKKRLTVAQDRYRKMVRSNEINRKESNLTTSAVAGAALGGVLGHKKLGFKKAGLIGAAAGLGAQTGLLLHGRTTRDPFGEESISAKRIERIPYQAAGLGLAGIGAHKLYKHYKLQSKGKEIRFAMTPEQKERARQLRRWEPEHLNRRAEEIYTKVGRAHRLGRDLLKKVRGQKDLDVRGRERTPEWKKTWAKRALAVGALGLAFRYRGLAKRALHTPLGKRAESGFRGAMNKSPLFKQTVESAREYGHGVRQEWGDLKKEMKAEPKSAEDAVKEYKESMAEKSAQAERRKKGIKEAVNTGNPIKFRARLREIKFAQVNPDWDIRDRRGKSARIFAPGHQQRVRRPKKWHEKKSNRDLIGALLGVGALGTGGIGIEIRHRRRQAAEEAAADAAQAESKVIRPSFSPLEQLRRDFHPHKLSSKVKLTEFGFPYRLQIRRTDDEEVKPSRKAVNVGGALLAGGALGAVGGQLGKDLYEGAKKLFRKKKI